MRFLIVHQPGLEGGEFKEGLILQMRIGLFLFSAQGGERRRNNVERRGNIYWHFNESVIQNFKQKLHSQANSAIWTKICH